MTTETGNGGLMKVDGVTVGELRSWKRGTGVGTVDDTVIGDTWETHKTIQKSWSVQADAFHDAADSAQAALTEGASVVLRLYPSGATAGLKYWTGTATVEKVDHQGSHNGIIEVSYQFKGNGALSLVTI